MTSEHKLTAIIVFLAFLLFSGLIGHMHYTYAVLPRIMAEKNFCYQWVGLQPGTNAGTFTYAPCAVGK